MYKAHKIALLLCLLALIFVGIDAIKQKNKLLKEQEKQDILLQIK